LFGVQLEFDLLFLSSQDFRANKPSDIISTLVSIYDSKDLFVKELQVLLAQRLLALKDDDVEKVEREVLLFAYYRIHKMLMSPPFPLEQRRNIEILKIRFGEVALQVCEVMLRDMTDSKRIDGHVQSQQPVSFYASDARLNPDRELKTQSVIHPTIISRHFWPSLESSDITMPGQFQKCVYFSFPLRW